MIWKQSSSANIVDSSKMRDAGPAPSSSNNTCRSVSPSPHIVINRQVAKHQREVSGKETIPLSPSLSPQAKANQTVGDNISHVPAVSLPVQQKDTLLPEFPQDRPDGRAHYRRSTVGAMDSEGMVKAVTK